MVDLSSTAIYCSRKKRRARALSGMLNKIHLEVGGSFKNEETSDQITEDRPVGGVGLAVPTHRTPSHAYDPVVESIVGIAAGLNEEDLEQLLFFAEDLSDAALQPSSAPKGEMGV